MSKRKHAFTRILSFLLVLVTVLSIPISALAAGAEETAGPYGVSTAAITDGRATLMDHSAFRALKYLGYD